MAPTQVAGVLAHPLKSFRSGAKAKSVSERVTRSELDSVKFQSGTYLGSRQ